MAHLGREAVETRTGEGDRAQQLGMTVPRDDLRGDVLAAQAEAGEHTGLVLRVGGCIGADSAGGAADANAREGAPEAQQGAVSLEGEAGGDDTAGGGLGVDAVGAPDT